MTQAEQEQLDSAREAAGEVASDAAAQLAAQLLVPQLAAMSDQLAPNASSPLATGQIATDAQKLTAPELTPGQAAAPTNPLYLQFVTESGQNSPQLPEAVPPAARPADVAPQLTVPVPPQPVVQPTVPAATAQAAADAVQPAPFQVVPAQVPIVSGLLPTQPAAPALPTQMAAPQAPIGATALPDVLIGDRPGTAGEQLASIASAATSIGPAPQAQTQTAFATTLAGTVADLMSSASATIAADATSAVPNQLAAPDEGRASKYDAADAVPAANVPGTGSPFAQTVHAPQSAAAVQAPDPVAQVADGIVTHAHTVTRGGETEFRLRLDPPELGALRIRLISDGDSINGQVVVSNDAIRRMIESQLPELRQRLEAAGVTVQNFDVTTDTSPGSGSDTGGWNAYRTEPPADLARSSAAALPARTATARATGAIDVMV